jgi:hypothetical protein
MYLFYKKIKFFFQTVLFFVNSLSHISSLVLVSYSVLEVLFTLELELTEPAPAVCNPSYIHDDASGFLESLGIRRDYCNNSFSENM